MANSGHLVCSVYEPWGHPGMTPNSNLKSQNSNLIPNRGHSCAVHFSIQTLLICNKTGKIKWTGKLHLNLRKGCLFAKTLTLLRPGKRWSTATGYSNKPFIKIKFFLSVVIISQNVSPHGTVELTAHNVYIFVVFYIQNEVKSVAQLLTKIS